MSDTKAKADRGDTGGNTSARPADDLGAAGRSSPPPPARRPRTFPPWG